MFYERREDILAKIKSRLSIIDLGYKVNGVSSPCHIWQGPTSGNGHSRIGIRLMNSLVHRYFMKGI